MATVYTKEEFKQALKNRERHIVCKGEMARVFQSRQKRKKTAKVVGGITAALGVLAIPFTGGASAAATAAGLTIGTLTISTAELLIIVGGGVALAGIIPLPKIRQGLTFV